MVVRDLARCSLILLTVACGDTKSGSEASSSSTSSTSTESAATTTAGSTDPATGGSSSDTTGTPTSEPIGTSTTEPTSDPTAGSGGNFCQEKCVTDEDCRLDGVDHGYRCRDGTCSDGPTICEEDIDCRALLSGWLPSCTTNMDCLTDFVCIDVDGEAMCALQPTESLGCEELHWVETMMPLWEGGTPVVVCVDDKYTCEANDCVIVCANDDKCANVPGHPQCNVGSGKCECTSDDDCKSADIAEYRACNDGACGCASDSDCGVGTDVCNDNGMCGCSDASVCVFKFFDGTVLACEGA